MAGQVSRLLGQYLLDTHSSTGGLYFLAFSRLDFQVDFKRKYKRKQNRTKGKRGQMDLNFFATEGKNVISITFLKALFLFTYVFS